MRIFALRGAISVDHNDRDAILAASEQLVREVMERNDLPPARMVSCLFTMTVDLDAEFPAVAARGLGLDQVPLICAQEIDKPGAMPRLIRLLLHYYADDEHVPRHVYLGEARALRTDLEAAQ